MTRTESCFNFKNVEFGRITCFFYFTFTFKESVILNFREIIPPQQSFIYFQHRIFISTVLCKNSEL